MRKPPYCIATDKVKLNHRIHLVHEVLSDLSTYKLWWLGATFKQLDENSVKVSPKGPGSFTWSITENKPELITLTYKGMFEGKGSWRLDQKGATTHLSYHIELVIVHPLIKLINRFLPIATLHSKMMVQVFASLDQYLNNLHHPKED